ncbi:MAG: hypothetical protein A4E65_02451 [Syntrophorhabdus sp. PtaU1.Bin153]|nr:MAG: hypothetical protein A4E65_02451 [Syntrophorhabdus sp. PtaU1.Bin153]
MVDKKGKMTGEDRNRQTPEGPAPVPARLGQVLVRAGRITPGELEKALNEQGLSNKRLGEILIEKGYIKPEELTHGLNVQSMILSAGLTTVRSLGSLLEGKGPTSPSDSERDLDGKGAAQVPTRSHLAVLRQMSSIVLTDDHVRNGYIDLLNATRLAVSSNDRSGYLLVFDGLGWPFRGVHVFGLLKDIHMESSSISVYQPFCEDAPTMELSYRFKLSDDAEPGKYGWPLSISLQPV